MPAGAQKLSGEGVKGALNVPAASTGAGAMSGLSPQAHPRQRLRLRQRQRLRQHLRQHLRQRQSQRLRQRRCQGQSLHLCQLRR